MREKEIRCFLNSDSRLMKAFCALFDFGCFPLSICALFRCPLYIYSRPLFFLCSSSSVVSLHTLLSVLFVVAGLFCDYRLVVQNVNTLSMEALLSLKLNTMASIRLMCRYTHKTPNSANTLAPQLFYAFRSGYGLWMSLPATAEIKNTKSIFCPNHIYCLVVCFSLYSCGKKRKLIMLVYVFPESRQQCLIGENCSTKNNNSNRQVLVLLE